MNATVTSAFAQSLMTVVLIVSSFHVSIT